MTTLLTSINNIGAYATLNLIYYLSIEKEKKNPYKYFSVLAITWSGCYLLLIIALFFFYMRFHEIVGQSTHKT